MKECVVNVTYGDNCNILLGVYEVSDKGDKLETPPLGFIEDVDHYCYSVTTRNQNLSVIVEGVINLQRSSGTNGIQNLSGTYFRHDVYIVINGQLQEKRVYSMRERERVITSRYTACSCPG